MASCRGHGLGAPDTPTKPQDPRNMASRGIGLFGPSGVGERRLCRAQNEKTCQKAGFSGLPGKSVDFPGASNGAGTRSRTRDLLITSQLLYQLSYTGICGRQLYPYSVGCKPRKRVFNVFRALSSKSLCTIAKRPVGAARILCVVSRIFSTGCFCCLYFLILACRHYRGGLPCVLMSQGFENYQQSYPQAGVANSAKGGIGGLRRQ